MNEIKMGHGCMYCIGQGDKFVLLVEDGHEVKFV